ncbi:MAG: transposase, partial [Candidatus Eisenbacteria bacterium]|nr:transposase [Candidatus Eisenbacteria bacterium]
MRRRKRTLTRRVNRNLRVEFGDEKLTSHAGLEILGSFLQEKLFNTKLRDAFRDIDLKGDYPLPSMVRVFLALLWTGGRRLRHVRFLDRDPLVRRFCGLDHLPDERTLSRWLKQFT